MTKEKKVKLTKVDKFYIKNNAGKLGIEQLAKDVGVDETVVQEYLNTVPPSYIKKHNAIIWTEAASMHGQKKT